MYFMIQFRNFSNLIQETCYYSEIGDIFNVMLGKV